MTNRLKTWCDIHILLSTFFLPIALVYAVTGGLYVMGVKGESHGPRPPAGMMQRMPDGRGAYGFGERGSGGHGAFRPGGEGPGRGFKKPTGLYDRIMLLHKAKGGPVFNVVGAAFAVSMLVMYVSGVVVAWASPAKRRRMLITAAIGLAVAVVAIATSL